MPAFASDHSFGLTKREYFAAMAMQGILSNLKSYVDFFASQNTASGYLRITEQCKKMADELIKELNK